jgi:hypothetical protein
MFGQLAEKVAMPLFAVERGPALNAIGGSEAGSAFGSYGALDYRMVDR